MHLIGVRAGREGRETQHAREAVIHNAHSKSAHEAPRRLHHTRPPPQTENNTKRQLRNVRRTERAATAPNTQKIAKQKIKKARFIVPSSLFLRASAELLDVKLSLTVG